MAGLIPWPPPVTTGMTAAWDAGRHNAEFGGNYSTLRNQVNDALMPNTNASRFLATGVLNDTVFFNASDNGSSDWPSGDSPRRGHAGYWGPLPDAAYRVIKATEILIFPSPIPPDSGGAWNQSGPSAYTGGWLVIDGVTRRGPLYLVGRDDDSGYVLFPWIAVENRSPWTMVTVFRDNEAANLVPQPGVHFKQDKDARVAVSPPGIEFYSEVNEYALAGPEGAYAYMYYDRVLTDVEIDAIHGWVETWLGEQIIPSTYVTGVLFATTSGYFSWDAAHGTPDVHCDDGRTFSAVATPWVDMVDPATIDPLYPQRIYTFIFPDETSQDVPITYAPAFTELPITASDVQPTQVTFTLPEAAAYNMWVYVDGVLANYWTAGLVSFTQTGLSPEVPYRFDFQEEGTEPPPAGFATLYETTASGVRAAFTRLSTFTYSADWDMAHGEASIVCTDGRQFADAVSPWLDVSPITQEYAADFGYTITWEVDLVQEQVLFQRWEPVRIGFQVVVVKHDLVTFSIPPQPYDIIVYRDSVNHATIPAGVAEYTDATLLNPDTEYSYRFEQVYTGQPCQGWDAAQVRTRTVSAPASEYWVSQGGVWVKANEALVSFKGEWVPMTGTDTGE